MKRPTLHLAVEFNRRVRSADEWFDEPDDLDRVEKALASIGEIESPLEAAASLAYRVTRAQGFTEGNKRTALLLARWILDNNGLDGSRVIRPNDRVLADFLISAASEKDVESDLVKLFVNRSS